MEAVPKMVREEDHQAEYDAADRWICSHPGVTHGDVKNESKTVLYHVVCGSSMDG